MKDNIYRFLVSLLLAIFSITMPAADLPQLPASSKIKTGVLDNGVSYYIVTNSTEKGKADIALVQRCGYGNENGAMVGTSAVNAMGALTSLPHFRTDTPFSYLSRNCIWPGARGYVAVYSDAAVYRFNGLDLSRSKEVVDSTLLLVLDVIGMQSDVLGARYSPENQAIVISGDIDTGAVLNKMNMLSMLVTRRPANKAVQDYKWEHSEEALFRYVKDDVKGRVSITAEYRSPRTPKNNMNTVQPLVSKKFASEFGILIKKRLSTALRRADVPVSEVSFSYLGSPSGPGDETYRTTITTSPACLGKAVSILSGTLADLDKVGVSIDEYRDAENELVMNMRREYSGDVTANSRYIEQCLSSFLYGSSLASASTSMNFFLTKNIQDDLGVKLFNNFIFALLDKSHNLTVECRADSSVVAGLDIPGKFASSWSSGNVQTYTISNSDTLSLKKLSTKTKIKMVSPEPLSGGQIWTFDNGIKVIYKNVPKSGMFHYMWLLKGGYSLIPGLKPGEGAYISDLLHLYDVSGMSCYRFADMLAANGITMNGEVTVSDFRISGAAPSSRLRLVLKALCSLAEERTINKDAYDYYKKCQALAFVGGSSIESKIDSLLFQGSAWSPYKRPVSLGVDFQKRAEKFYGNEFSKMNDGVLVLVGDFDEFSLKKDLCRDLGSFSTEKVSSSRSRIQYKTTSGRVSRIIEGSEPSIGVGISSPLMYTATNFMASQIAAMKLSDDFSDALAECGWYGESSWDFAMFPEERFNYTISCSMSDRVGVPASLAQSDSVEFVISQMRRAILKSASGITTKDFAAYRSMLLKSMEARMSDPETIMSMLVLRYSYGKDIVTKYKDKINAVTIDDVNNILKTMAGSRIAEYAIRRHEEGEHIHEKQNKGPVFTGIIPMIVPAGDSLMLGRDAFRLIGIDSTYLRPDWNDSTVFISRKGEFPKPNVLVNGRELSVVTDSIKVEADSSILLPADTLSVQVLEEENNE